MFILLVKLDLMYTAFVDISICFPRSKSGNHSGYFNAKQCSYDFCGVPCPNGGATTFMRYLPYQMNFTVQDLFGTVHSTVTVRTMPRIGIVHWVL